MSRVARIVVPGIPHHVTQRGNRRCDVFHTDEDRHAYLGFLKKYCDKYDLTVWAYCLMTNHVHLVVVPEREDSLAKALRDAHTVHAMRFNTRMRLSGHLWQGRFYSCPLDDAHLWAAVRYVERNPVRAEEYAWSSASAHCGLRTDPVLSRTFPEPGIIDDWKHWLKDDDIAGATSVRRCTRTGRPCGGRDFVARLESMLGRVLGPNRRGRKRSAQSNEGRSDEQLQFNS